MPGWHCPFIPSHSPRPPGWEEVLGPVLGPGDSDTSGVVCPPVPPQGADKQGTERPPSEGQRSPGGNRGSGKTPSGRERSWALKAEHRRRRARGAPGGGASGKGTGGKMRAPARSARWRGLPFPGGSGIPGWEFCGSGRAWERWQGRPALPAGPAGSRPHAHTPTGRIRKGARVARSNAPGLGRPRAVDLLGWEWRQDEPSSQLFPRGC